MLQNPSGLLMIAPASVKDVNVSPITVGRRVTVTGFSSEFDGVPEIDIRGPRDLVRSGR